MLPDPFSSDQIEIYKSETLSGGQSYGKPKNTKYKGELGGGMAHIESYGL